MPFSRSISPQSTRRAQRLFKIFFLGVLCELCGELLVSFSIKLVFLGPAAALTPETYNSEMTGFRLSPE